MGDVCDQDWKKCCQEFSCSHQEIVDQCTRIFSQYDSQVKSSFGFKLQNWIQLHDGKNCDFNGHAMKDFGKETTTQDFGKETTAPSDPIETCKGNPNASNPSLCSGMEWACGPNQTYADIQVRTHIYGCRLQINYLSKYLS